MSAKNWIISSMLDAKSALGSPFEIAEPLADFDPKYINDGQLGLI